MPHHLPPNATTLEKNLSLTLAKTTALPLNINTLTNPKTCPVHLLPWLAWTLSIETWHQDWSETQKRDVLASAIATHQKKGTKAGVLNALATLGYSAKISEWFETGGDPFTFSIDVDITNTPLDESKSNQIYEIIDATKNSRSHYTAKVNLLSQVSTALKLTAQTGETLTIYPYTPANIIVGSPLYFAAATLTYDTLKINPKET